MAIRFSINAHFEGIFGFDLVRRFRTIEKRPLAKTTTKAEAKAEAEIGVQKLVGTSERQPPEKNSNRVPSIPLPPWHLHLP